MGIYTTVALVRAEPEVPDAAGPAPADDATLESYITQAEDALDGWLGGWPVQLTGPSEGRKIVQANVDAWRWTKLQRAATRLAARIYENPKVLQPARHGFVKGPDFETRDPRPATAALRDVVLPLRDSGLRRIAARAYP